MLGDEINGADETRPTTDTVAPPAHEGQPENAPEKKVANTARVDDDGVMRLEIHLEAWENSFAAAIGSLDLAKDMVKNYFGQKAMADAAMKARATLKIIRPGAN